MRDFQYRILGPVEVWLDGRPVPIDAARQRAVLAALLLEANRVVPVDRLIDRLWGAAPPARARNTVQSLILRLRRVLGPDGMLVTQRPGYLLRVAPGNLDLDVFEELASAGRAALDAGDAERAARDFRAALALWRGEPLSGTAAAMDEAEVGRLRERRLRVTEDRVEAELLCGRHADVVAWVTALVAENPLRERFSGQLMLALHRSGRRAEALLVFQTLRRRLVDELAVEPCEAVQRIHRQVLAHEAGAEASVPEASHAAPGPGVETGRAGMVLRLKVSGPRQLPPDVADFTGRGALLDRLRRLLTGPDTLGVSVSGRAGAGKTALAVHIGHMLAGEFDGGQIFVDLHGMDPRPPGPGAALAQILRALGVEPTAIPDSADERAGMYRGLMAERRVLVVLDNAADESQVRPLLPGSGPGRVIVTSRRLLASLGAWLPAVPLELLTHGESVQLLTRMLGEERIRGQEGAAHQIAIQCGHLPLALRIAGARLAARPHWSLLRMAATLADTRRRLDELSEGDLEVRASVGMSMAGLAEQERSAVARLGGLWCPDFAGWLAAAALGLPLAEAEEMAERLVDAQLLEALGFDGAGQSRYRFHDLVRDYARELVTGNTNEALDACLTAVHHAAVEVLGGGDPLSARSPHRTCVHCGQIVGLGRSLAWFAAERSTLTSAVSHALDRSLPGHAWRIASLSAVFFEVRADWDDWWQTHRAALDAVPQNDPRAEAALLCGLSRLDIDKGDAGSAGEHARRAVELSRAAGEPGLEAEALASLGFALWHDSRHLPAGRSFKAGLRLAAKAGYRAAEVRCLLGLGHLYRDLGRHDDAILALENAITLIRKGAARYEEPYALVCLGAVHLACERPGAAAAQFRQAMVLATAQGDARCQVYAMRLLADAHRLSGDPAEAERLLRLVPLIMRGPGEEVGEVQRLRRLGEALTDLGRFSEAIEELRLGLELIRRIGFPRIEAEVLHALGHAQLRAGDQRAATAALSGSRDLFARCGLPERSAQVARLMEETR